MYAPPQATSHPPSHHHPQRRPSWLLVGGLLTLGVAVLLVILGGIIGVYYLTTSEAPRVASGVQVAGLAVGGETMQTAADAIAQQNYGAQPITLTDQDRQWTRTLAEMGISVNVTATMQLVEDASANATIQPVYAIDMAQASNALIALSDEVTIDAVPGDPPQIGRALDIPAMLSRLNTNLAGEIADGMVKLTIIETEPPAYDPAVHYTGETTIHVVERGQELALIARMYGVDMNEIVAMNDIANPDLLYIGQELTIPAGGLYSPAANDAPAAPTPVGKSIVVSTQEQRIYAYEDGQLVRSRLVSTGLPDTPTVHGDYSIYVKFVADDMSGPDYFLPQVPYTMYFYQGYGIHGTYWHNSFGRPMSHGCVNLPTEEARWFFEWAEVGTPVRVI